MTSHERIDTTLSFRPPDRVPVALHNFQPAAAATGLPFSEVFTKGEFLADAMIQGWREFGQDMILLENGTACSAQACGVEVAYRDDMAPVALKPRLRSLDEVADLEVPDPYTTFPMNEVIKATRLVAKELGDRVWIVGRADQGAFGLSAQLRGVNEFLLEVAGGEDHKQVKALLEFSEQVAVRYAAALLRSGAHSVSIGDSLSGPEMLSPAQYRQVALPYQQQFVKRVKRMGGIAHLHICGNVEPILPDLVAIGAQVVEVDHKTSMRAAKRQSVGRATLLGNIDTSLLSRGTPDQVGVAAREAIETLGQGHGFILGPGCAMGSETPAENIHALVQTAREYGSIR